MEQKTRQYLDAAGSKVGLLNRVWELENGKEKIMPFVALFPWEVFTDKHNTELKKLCWQYGSDWIIIRTTHRSDFEWMVDVMPTETSCHKDNIQATLEEMNNELRDPEVIAYSKMEWSWYDPDEVVFSIAPAIKWPWWTLTEHPNQKDRLLLDVFNRWGAQDSNVIDFNSWDDVSEWKGVNIDKWKISDLVTAVQVDRIRLIQNWLREAWLFVENRSLQLEWVFFKNLPLITQIRDFAEKKIIEPYDNVKKISWRVFGITPESWINLPIEIWNTRDLAMESWDKKGSPYILSPVFISSRLCWTDFPKNMKGYVPLAHGSALGMYSLAHNNTRFIKICLERWWVAVLDRIISEQILDNAVTWDVLNIISDWRWFSYKVLSDRPKKSPLDDPRLQI